MEALKVISILLKQIRQFEFVVNLEQAGWQLALTLFKEEGKNQEKIL